jgi:hypothetical protein
LNLNHLKRPTKNKQPFLIKKKKQKVKKFKLKSLPTKYEKKLGRNGVELECEVRGLG